MDNYYFSGIDRGLFVDLLAREGAAGMVNATCAAERSIEEAVSNFPNVPLVLDSGAFQGVNDLDWYRLILRRCGWRYTWAANLDVIGDQESSDHNYEELLGDFGNILWIYQVRGGSDHDRLREMAGKLGYVGIGGLVPVIRDGVDAAMKEIESIGRTLEKEGAKAHFFGVGSFGLLHSYREEPWFSSADSATWLIGVKGRELLRRGGERFLADDFGLAFSREECAAQNIRQYLRLIKPERKSVQLSLLEPVF